MAAKYIIVVPAYGRDYKNESEVKKDFDANKDFVIQDISCPYDGKYANKSDLKGYRVKIRYNKLQDITILNA